MGNERKPMGYWNYEHCYEEAKKYTTRGEFATKSKSAYTIAWRNGWLHDYTWFTEIVKPNGYWTRETCFEAAMNHKTQTDFKMRCPGAYRVAYKNGWLIDYSWFKKQTHEDADYIVYAYEDESNKVAYVGLTYRPKGRHNYHKTMKSPVGRYFNGCIPEPIVLKTGLTQIDAKYYEERFENEYIDNGWTVLNKAKTGVKSSSVGGGVYKWTRETCYEEAQKYSTLKEFRNAYGAYFAARTNGWLNDYIWLEKDSRFCKRWTYDSCYSEAKLCTTLKEFKREHKSAYFAAYKNGWLKDYSWLAKKAKPNGYWVQETCYDEALKYKTRNEFRKNGKGAYNVAKRNGWLDSYVWFSPSQSAKKWTRETCYAEAKKYKTKTEFCDNCQRAFQVAKCNGWLDDYTWFRKRFIWTFDEVRNAAKTYKTRGMFAKNNKGAYYAAIRNKWIDLLFPKKYSNNAA